MRIEVFNVARQVMCEFFMEEEEVEHSRALETIRNRLKEEGFMVRGKEQEINEEINHALGCLFK